MAKLKTPIVVVGMARSGTTLVSHILGSSPETHVEVEPHALWKTGNFKYLNDEEFRVENAIVDKIRKKFLKGLPEGKVLVEKSPINCIRPEIVHAVFPEAKVVYIERDPVRCVYSNYTRSLKKDSFKLSIVLKKYFFYTGSKDLGGAISKRSLFSQIALTDIPYFIRYAAYMFYLRNILDLLPFGTKLSGFVKTVKEEGLLKYHVKVLVKAQKSKLIYKNLYGDKMQTFRMEELMRNPDKIRELLQFCELRSNDKWVEEISSTFDEERVRKSNQQSQFDEQISNLLNMN